MILSSSHSDNTSHVIFKDGGIISYSPSDDIKTIYSTTQSSQFLNNNINLSVEKKESLFDDIHSEYDRLGISSLELTVLDKHFEEGKYFYGDVIELSDGTALFADDKGISVHKNKDNMHLALSGDIEASNQAKLYSFKDFLLEYEDKVSVSAIKELSKYAVEQDTGSSIINPFNLTPEGINFTDMATSLSGINRFAGQTEKLYGSDNEFYTVGQHCLAGYHYILNHPSKEEYSALSDEQKGNFPYHEDFCKFTQNQKQILANAFANHEFFEAITGIDLIKPFKYADTDGAYFTAEKKGEDVFELFKGSPVMTPTLKKIDNLMASIEGRELVGWDRDNNNNVSADVLFMVHDNQKLVQSEVKKQLLNIWEESGTIGKINDFIKMRDKYKEHTLHSRLEHSSNLDVNKWRPIDQNSLEEEWNTETLDSIFFSGYPTEKQLKETKDIFFDKFNDFTNIEIIDYKEIAKDIYGSDKYTFDELKDITAYMKKDIDFIKKGIENNELAMPLLMRKNGELSVLGGRTRSSVARLMGEELQGAVIDYDKMTKSFYRLREKEFMNVGYGVFAMEEQKLRFKLLHQIKKGTAESMLDDIPILDGLTTEQKKSELNDLKYHLFGNAHPIEQITTIDISDVVTVDEKVLTNISIKDLKNIKSDLLDEPIFKNSSVLDSDLSLATVYHGTDDDWNDFEDKNTWFTNSKDIALSFGENLKEVVLNIENPLDLSTKDGKEIVKQALYQNAITDIKNEFMESFNLDVKNVNDYSDYIKKMRNLGVQKDTIDKYSDLYLKYGMMDDMSEYLIYQHWDKIIDFAKEAGYDGIKSLEEPNNRKSGIGMQVGYVVFSSEQIMYKKDYIDKEKIQYRIKDINHNRKESNLKYTLIAGEQMFNDRVGFEEISNDKDYFLNQKDGLKAVVVSMPPEDYIRVVEDRQPDHKRYGASQDKLDNLKDVYEAGIKVDIPILGFGSRERASDDFSQEGYHRASSASMINKELIPVAIRYREDDENIPDFIKEHIESSQLEIIDKNIQEESIDIKR